MRTPSVGPPTAVWINDPVRLSASQDAAQSSVEVDLESPITKGNADGWLVRSGMLIVPSTGVSLTARSVSGTGGRTNL